MTTGEAAPVRTPAQAAAVFEAVVANVARVVHGNDDARGSGAEAPRRGSAGEDQAAPASVT